MKQNFLNSLVAVIGSFITFLIGEWSQMLTLLAFVIIIDYTSGVLSAIINKNISSSIGYKGLIKKFGIVMIVVLSHQLDKYMGTSFIMSGTILFFVTNELISIIENYGKIGLPLPPQIKNIILLLKDKKNDKTL